MNKPSLAWLFLIHIFLIVLLVYGLIIWHLPLSALVLISVIGITTSILLISWINQSFVLPFASLRDFLRELLKEDLSRIQPPHLDRTLSHLEDELEVALIKFQNKYRQISEGENEIKTIITHMVEGVLVIGQDGRILFFNTAVLQILDLRSYEVQGRLYWEMIRNEEVNSLLKTALKEKRVLKKEITGQLFKEGYFSMTISPLLQHDGVLNGIVAVFHDITDVKKSEKMRTEFVANVSHELKTPLTTIRGFVETLADGAITDKEKAGKFLDIIRTHTKRLENLVNDLLNLSKVESGDLKINFERTNVVEIVQRVMDSQEESFEKKHQHVQIHYPKVLPAVMVDVSQMEQVFENLLENAIKYTPAGGKIEFILSADPDWVRIDVKDSGIGIPVDQLTRIFERFYRVDKARSRDQGGTGLGLSIVKHIVNLHKGRVFVESKTGEGSTFSVFLPLDQS